ncbi:hypothetical protein Cantr_00953 [Candida viswanathii]|uniref:Uncharacterized protein n=1 Tax=Candida viswanathii TaxID=5486 RepID=A0A367YH69_9ASCO|nr:hypothetical protein Cantr_00953 [Candida viswanathii]
MSSIDKNILAKDDEADESIQPEASSSNSVITDHMKNPHRIKLAPDEIKLIMYLIVEIKPFKYVGDKSLSQTKKWELIQSKYYEAKRQERDSEFIVPTVRTLQRQLTAGLKKAEERRKKKRVHQPTRLLADTERVVEERFAKLSVQSATNHELEDMAYDLNELSDHIKKMKANPPPRSSSIQRIMNPQPDSPQQPHIQPSPQLQLQQPPQQPQPAYSPPLAHATPLPQRILHDPPDGLPPALAVQQQLQVVEELQTELESIVDRLRSVKQKLEKLK